MRNIEAIRRSRALLGLLALAAAFNAPAADVAGSRDHPMISRYAGSEIVKYEQKEFDAYTLALGRSQNRQAGPKPVRALEGRLTRVNYRAPEDARRSRFSATTSRRWQARDSKCCFAARTRRAGP